MKLFILLIIIIEYIFDEYLTYRIWKQRSKPLPEEVKDIYDHDRYLEFIEYKKAGQKLTANRYVEWFLENISENVVIPYRESNIKNKLIQLAQQNNLELKKAFA